MTGSEKLLTELLLPALSSLKTIQITKENNEKTSVHAGEYSCLKWQGTNTTGKLSMKPWRSSHKAYNASEGLGWHSFLIDVQSLIPRVNQKQL